MKPKTIYICSSCGKEYDIYDKAESCCQCSGEDEKIITDEFNRVMKEIPKRIETPKDYIRVVLGINKLEKIRVKQLKYGLNTCYNVISNLKQDCYWYLDDIAKKMIDKLNSEIENEIEIDGKIYSIFDADDIMSYYYDGDYGKYYDFVREVKK